MGKINLNDFGGVQGDKFVADDLEGDVVVLTVSEYGTQKMKGEQKLSAYLRFTEAPEKILYLNRTQVERLVAKLGDDTDRWVGKLVPLHKEEAAFEGQRFLKVYVMPAAEWADVLAEAGVTTKAAAITGAKKATVKGVGKPVAKKAAKK